MSVYVHNLIYFMLDALLFTNSISSMHDAYPLFSNVHAQDFGTRTFLLRKSYESFDAVVAKKLRKFQYWVKKAFV